MAKDQGLHQSDLFLSHRSTDAGPARNLAESVEAAVGPSGTPLKVFFDEWDIQPGQSIPGRINTGLDGARYVGLFLTPEYFESESGWTDAEWLAALHQDPAGRASRVLPLLFRTCRLPPLLAHLDLIDLRDGEYDKGLRRLLAFLQNRPGRDRARLHQQHAPSLVPVGMPSRAFPDVIDEQLESNLFRVDPPTFLWSAPIRPALGTARGLPEKRRLDEIIAGARAEQGLPPYKPVFVRHGDRVLALHDLERAENPLATVATEIGVERMRLRDFARTGDDEQHLAVRLLNICIRKKLLNPASGMQYERVKQRFCWTPLDGGDRPVTWRKRGRPRTVTSYNAAYTCWRHHAANLRFKRLGTQWFLLVRPTVLFTEDGSVGSVLTSTRLSGLAARYRGQDRNGHDRYHVHFWMHILGDGQKPIRIRAGDQILFIHHEPLMFSLPVGLDGDHVDIHSQLIDGPDEDSIEADAAGDDDDGLLAAG